MIGIHKSNQKKKNLNQFGLTLLTRNMKYEIEKTPWEKKIMKFKAQ